MINAFRKIEIKKMGLSEFMEPTELSSIQSLSNIFPLTLSLSPKGRGIG